MNRSRCGWCLAVLVVAVAMNARAQALDDATPPPIEEDDESAPVDWGYGPGVPPNNDMRAAQEMIAAPAAAPVGGPDAQTKGVFGPPVTWPIIAIHAVILPDGRVMNYGTNKQGQQGAELMYDVWDPKQGRGNGAHTVLPNTTNTDIFCGAQSVIPASGEVLITGGDKEINGEQHFSDRRTSVFHPRTNKITTSAPMQYARWYPTLVGLPTGEMLVLGGRKDKVPETPPGPPRRLLRMWVGGRFRARPAMRPSGPRKLGIIRARSSRPTAKSSCWVKMAKCSMWTRRGGARSLS